MVKVRLHPEVECQMKVWVVKGDDAGEAKRREREGARATDEAEAESETLADEESSGESDEEET